MLITCKFGGTSLACSENIRRCAEIVKADANRRFIVVSAPGKKNKKSKKVTDLLYDCYVNRFDEEKFDEIFSVIKATFREIATLIEKPILEEELATVYDQIKNPEANLDFVLSRGEYLNARIIAQYLGYEFLDSAKFIRFKNGELDLSKTSEKASLINRKGRFVIPGFYGLDEDGHIKAFSRGGSDITGSIVARVFDCDLYENWTDVDGIHVCDPKVIANSKKVEQVSFRELREMSYMGASVLHAETLLPIYDHPIPILLKNSFSPQESGTQILKKRTEVSDKETITCITGKNDYTCIQISKMMLDKQLGFVKKATSVFEEYNINISHTHSGLDNLCFFVEQSQYEKISFEEFLSVLESRIKADKIKGYEKIALLAVIGHNLSGKVGILAKIFNALKDSRISVKTIYQSVSECNIIIGVENYQLNDGIKAIYQELIEFENKERGTEMKKIITFGELMLRLAPENYLRFVQSEKYEATFGGAEANVAVSLANYGMDVAFVTKLPAHEIGQSAVNSLRKFGVDTSKIVRGGERVGIYYCEKGASQRPSKVIYDRAYSAIAMAKKEDFDWDKIFDGVEWFHFTGITPALSDEVAEICIKACQKAKEKNITISCDLNFRKKLWSKEKAGKVMGELCQYIDYCIANEEDAKDVFGIEADNTDIYGGKLDRNGYISVAKKLTDRFNFKGVAITLRESKSANDNDWSGMLYTDGQAYFSKKYSMHIVDRVGGGDSFGGGLIYSLMNGFEPQKAIEFAVAASCLKHTIEGDYNMVSVAEVNNLAGGDASGRVQR